MKGENNGKRRRMQFALRRKKPNAIRANVVINGDKRADGDKVYAHCPKTGMIVRVQ